jgi:hypothetical protein
MSKIPENPPAFARPLSIDKTSGDYPTYYGEQDGMSLRDYFAAKAMQGMLASGHETAIEKTAIAAGGDPIRGLALASYGMADAMLKVRDNV